MEEIKSTYLIVRYLSREATAEEEQQLLDWIEKEPANRKTFEDHHHLWEKELSDELSFDLTKGLQRLNYRVDLHEAFLKQSASRFDWRRVAAVSVFFLVSCLTVYFLGSYSGKNSGLADLEVHTTQADQRKEITLSDGSVIYVNSNSTVRFPKTFGKTREIYLSGEAFFEVTKDSLHPFIVHTQNLTTQVLGTSFNVKANANDIVVAVATGKVNVGNEDKIVALLPNEKVIYSHPSNQFVKSTTDLERELAWRTNTIIFQDTPLGDAARELEAKFGVNIVFDDAVLRTCVITGKYRNVSLEKILQAIGISTGMQFSIRNKEIKLSGSGCH